MKTAVFDLYGTLVDIHTDEEQPELWEKLALFASSNGARYTPGEMKEMYQILVEEEMQGRQSLREDSHEGNPEIDIEKVFEGLYRYKGVRADKALVDYTAKFFRLLSLEYIRLYEGAEELLQSLKDNGWRIVLLSNAQELFTLPELEALDLPKYFDSIYISSACGMKKPDLAFFEYMLDQEGLRPEECVMIGNDGVCDVEGAKKAGIPSIYIHSNISPEESDVKADWILEEMDLDAVRRILLTYYQNRLK